MEYTLEVIADSVASAMEAEQGGADRIELLANLPEGGTTPSYGLIAQVRKQVPISMHVMIRPRGGDFCYSDQEVEVMETDIIESKKLGVDGLVFGLLRTDKTVDVHRTKRLVDLARPLKVTFHRAFDLTPNPIAALSEIISTGADYLLTSGQETEALEGAQLISKLITRGKGKITVIPGSGIRSGNITDLLQKTGANEFHTSARTRALGKEADQEANDAFGFGTSSNSKGYMHVDIKEVRAIKSLLQAYEND